jgi:hypothetical protein
MAPEDRPCLHLSENTPRGRRFGPAVARPAVLKAEQLFQARLLAARYRAGINGILPHDASQLTNK